MAQYVVHNTTNRWQQIPPKRRDRKTKRAHNMFFAYKREDGGSIFIQNIGIYLQAPTASQPRTTQTY
jgi:hypothetical protein